ncbi:hypothetical protein [Candidatus Poriferisodalis sp.]|uniref:hypothetical protein n=1 Tax=Candidatus Poriferisodalis sp. TaxID=3101277 RepID=UPI003AF559DD
MRPLPAAPPANVPPQELGGWSKFGRLTAWALWSAFVWWWSFVVVWMGLIGDWDDPHPPNRIAAWSVALISMATIAVIGWRMRVRVVRYAALASLPVQLAWWAFMIPKAGIPN